MSALVKQILLKKQILKDFLFKKLHLASFTQKLKKKIKILLRIYFPVI